MKRRIQQTSSVIASEKLDSFTERQETTPFLPWKANAYNPLEAPLENEFL